MNGRNGSGSKAGTSRLDKKIKNSYHHTILSWSILDVGLNVCLKVFVTACEYLNASSSDTFLV